jgi:hypothetical protein
MIMVNVGDQRLARSFFRTARTAADETGDRHLRAWVVVREALAPLYYGDRSLVGVGLARCRLEADEPEEALRLGRGTLLAVPREHRSEIMLRTARSLGDVVAARHGEHLAVREYRDALVSA